MNLVEAVRAWSTETSGVPSGIHAVGRNTCQSHLMLADSLYGRLYISLAYIQLPPCIWDRLPTIFELLDHLGERLLRTTAN